MANCFYAFGRYLGIPLVGVETTTLTDWTHSAVGNPHEVAVIPSLYSTYAAPMNFYERLSNFFKTVYVESFFYFHVSDQDFYIQKHFGKNYPSARELAKDLDLLLVNYNQKLQGVRAFTPAVIPVGGLHIGDRSDQLTRVRFLKEN